MPASSRFIAALVLVAILGVVPGCASLGLTQDQRANLTPAARVFEAQGELNILLKALVAYKRQPACNATMAVGCADKKVLDQAVTLAVEARQLVAHARTMIEINPGTEQAALAAAAVRLALARFSAYMISHKVKP